MKAKKNYALFLFFLLFHNVVFPGDLPELGKDFEVITPFFTSEELSEFDQLTENIRSVECTSDESFYRENILSKADYQSYQFGYDHNLIGKSLKELEAITDDKVAKKIYVLLANKLAKKLNLVGTHSISIQTFRYLPPMDKHGMLSQSWHWDFLGKVSMIIEHYNDFEERNPTGGLDIAINQKIPDEKTFHGYCKDEDADPEDRYLTVKYPKNGCLLVHAQRGKVIHKASNFLYDNVGKTGKSRQTRSITQVVLLEDDCSQALEDFRHGKN